MIKMQNKFIRYLLYTGGAELFFGGANERRGRLAPADERRDPRRYPWTPGSSEDVLALPPLRLKLRLEKARSRFTPPVHSLKNPSTLVQRCFQIFIHLSIISWFQSCFRQFFVEKLSYFRNNKQLNKEEDAMFRFWSLLTFKIVCFLMYA